MKFRHLAALAILIASAILILIGVSKNRTRLVESDYVVCKGDCLWTIKDEVCPEYESTREWVDLVTKLNNLTSPLQPGQHIKVLIKGE